VFRSTYRWTTGLGCDLFFETVQGPKDAASLLRILCRQALRRGHRPVETFGIRKSDCISGKHVFQTRRPNILGVVGLHVVSMVGNKISSPLSKLTINVKTCTPVIEVLKKSSLA
jgi:hypothetical protein